MKEITSMKINLHCHSNYSDSYVSILEMAQEHQKLGFSAFVVTDHCYPFLIKEEAKNKRSITSFDQFCEQSKELEMASKKLDYPCIQGIELALFEEEVLVFGTDTIKKIFEYANNFNTKYLEKYGEFNSYHKVLSKKIANILKENKKDTAIILCHPRLLSKNQWEQNIIFNLIDGYEFQNNRTYHFSDETNLEAKYKWERPIPPELMNKKKFYNSDAHILKQISNAEGNFHSTKICTLDDLIKFIKTPTLNISMVNQKIIQDSKQKS